jgi:hydroxymethylpyrimidine kinase/phosphomethylpyrimidine kinase
VLAELLVPRAFLLTPNLHEAAVLTGSVVDDLASMGRAAEKLVSLGAKNVLVKGGHLEGDAVDVLFTQEGTVHEYPTPRIDTTHTHGTGCTYSAAITAELAKGVALRRAVAIAKEFVTNAIRENPGLGSGSGPLNHHA